MLYLEKLVDRINSLVKESLGEMFEEEHACIPSNPVEKPLYSEVIQHVTFCQQRFVLDAILIKSILHYFLHWQSVSSVHFLIEY